MAIQINDQNGKSIGAADSIGNVSNGTLVVAQSATPPVVPVDPTAFTYINAPSSPQKVYNPPSSHLVNWYCDDTVAAVTVSDNGVAIPNPRGGATNGPTCLYRLGGSPIPGITDQSGYFMWLVTPAGVHTFVFTAYDDNGAMIGTASRAVTVA